MLESIASAIRNAKGEVAKLVIVNRDITERKRAQEQLEHNSFHDALTGLPNRRLFLERLQHLFLRAQRSPDRHHAVLFLDLDGFRSSTTAWVRRWATGCWLKSGSGWARACEATTRFPVPRGKFPVKDAVLSRMGGDEFTILLEEVSDPSNAMRVAERILSAMAAPLMVEEQEVRRSVSVRNRSQHVIAGACRRSAAGCGSGHAPGQGSGRFTLRGV